MTISRTDRGTIQTTAAGPYSFAAFTPAPFSTLYLQGAITGASPVAAPSDDSGGAITWTRKQTNDGAGRSIGLWIGTLGATVGSYTITFDVTSGTSTGCVASLGETNAVYRQSNTNAGTSAAAPNVTVTDAILTSSFAIGSVFNNSNTPTLTPPVNWTEDNDVGYNTPTSGMETCYINTGETGTTITWQNTTGSAWRAYVAEFSDSNVVGSITATSTVTGVSAADKTSTGAVTATGAVTGVSAADKTATGSISATSTHAGTSAADKTATGSITVVGAVTGVSLADKIATGAITGTVVVDGVGDSVSDGQTTGTITATSTVTGISAADKVATGDISATSTVSGVGESSTSSEEAAHDVFAPGGGGETDVRRKRRRQDRETLLEEVRELYTGIREAAEETEDVELAASAAQIVRPFTDSSARLPLPSRIDFAGMLQDTESIRQVLNQLRLLTARVGAVQRLQRANEEAAIALLLL